MGSMPSFPWTPQFNGIVVIGICPDSSTEVSYWYIHENGVNCWRGGTLSGLRYTVTMPIRKGATYTTYASQNMSIEFSRVFKFIVNVE